eukprot:10135772-Alexandrium_andersonii.AAC.1
MEPPEWVEFDDLVRLWERQEAEHRQQRLQRRREHLMLRQDRIALARLRPRPRWVSAAAPPLFHDAVVAAEGGVQHG